MRKKLIALILGLFTLINISFAANYTIEKYDVDMQLQSDGSMQIQETIDANFSTSSHGIIRKIATKNPNNGRVTSISNARVQSDSFTTNTDGDYVSLKIGDPDQTILGNHQYKISYTVDNAIVSFDNNSWEELYWNVIGTEWDTSIDEVTFSLTLPKEYQSNGDKFYAVWGKNGEKKKENLIFNQDGNTNFKGKFIGNLLDGEGITIYIPFPSKYFSFPEHYNDYFRIHTPNFPTSTDAGKEESIISVELFLVLFFLIFFVGIPLFIAYRAISWIRKNRKTRETPMNTITNNSDIEAFTIGKNEEEIKEEFLAKKESKKINITMLYIPLGFFIVALPHIFDGWFGFLVVSLLLLSGFGFLLYRYSIYRGKKPVIPYYLPPKNLDPISLFAFAYHNGLAKGLMMTPLLYYRASKKWIKIRYTNQSSSSGRFSSDQSYFSIILDEKYKEKIGLWIFNTFFYRNNKLIIKKTHNNFLYNKITELNDQIQTLYQTEEKNLGWTQKKIILKYFYSYTLSEKGKALYDELNGFKYYLKKIERPQIELILKEDPEYISKILPRVALFGLKDKLSKKIGDIMESYTREWFEGTSSLEGLTLLSELNSSISSNEHSPSSHEYSRSSDSGDGGGSSGSSDSGSSGDGGGGGGGSSR